MGILVRLARAIDNLNEHVGRTVAWFALLMVLVQFLVVVMRYVFGVGSVFLQEGIVYLHGTLFMLAAAYTLRHDGHVRVDIFYHKASVKKKAWINLAGNLFFLLPMCVLVWWTAWPYVTNSWAVLEGSRETSGIPALYLFKTIILIFAALLGLQGIAGGIHALAVIGSAEKTTEERHAPVL